MTKQEKVGNIVAQVQKRTDVILFSIANKSVFSIYNTFDYSTFFVSLTPATSTMGSNYYIYDGTYFYDMLVLMAS